MTPSRQREVRKKSSGDKVTTLRWDDVSKNPGDADGGGADFIREIKGETVEGGGELLAKRQED